MNIMNYFSVGYQINPIPLIFTVKVKKNRNHGLGDLHRFTKIYIDLH